MISFVATFLDAWKLKHPTTRVSSSSLARKVTYGQLTHRSSCDLIVLSQRIFWRFSRRSDRAGRTARVAARRQDACAPVRVASSIQCSVSPVARDKNKRGDRRSVDRARRGLARASKERGNDRVFRIAARWVICALPGAVLLSSIAIAPFPAKLSKSGTGSRIERGFCCTREPYRAIVIALFPVAGGYLRSRARNSNALEYRLRTPACSFREPIEYLDHSFSSIFPHRNLIAIVDDLERSSSAVLHRLN